MAEVFGPDRADVAFECVGLAETANQAIRSVRKGGTVVVVGVFAETVPQLTWDSCRIANSKCGER